ncbi:ABC transporter ATP-binding protein [Compostimonas suwonensis]|uniref:Sulfonate transport system ATP-binding protein n=1 Tax=Compostimonas suwonensis TaxID=1048394 RepID=A0A2M9C4H0_9MICO|nr:ABC transporter ATP-binding protein [Compostimonas suwonensis]PJJ65430.1 sulfonate transport system ATP-binding protein [Compostimonas suwonensis]
MSSTAPATNGGTSVSSSVNGDAAGGVSNTAYEVEFRDVGRSFAATSKGRAAKGPARTVLRDVTLTVEPGEVLAILGTSGCGKSTLLRIAGGLDQPSVGSVRIDETPVSGIDTRTAVGFQEPRLLPWRTLTENVTLGLPAGTPKAEGRERVARLLELVGLAGSANLRPREVSGGMAQRASLARALARNPGVLLLDEPFGALDALTRLKMQDLLLEIHSAAPTTVLLVTHDVDEALQLADRVVLLGREEGVEGATIQQLLTVPGARPRDRGSAELAELRARLLAGLGIDRHGASRGIPTGTTIPHYPY